MLPASGFRIQFCGEDWEHIVALMLMERWQKCPGHLQHNAVHWLCGKIMEENACHNDLKNCKRKQPCNWRPVAIFQIRPILFRKDSILAGNQRHRGIMDITHLRTSLFGKFHKHAWQVFQLLDVNEPAFEDLQLFQLHAASVSRS